MIKYNEATKVRFRCLTYLLYATLLLPLIAHGQQYGHPDKEKIQQFTEDIRNIYGVDDELINGYTYIPPASIIVSHPYFLTENWRDGTVYMSGEVFHNQLIKYDLEKDAIILKARLQNEGSKIVHLNSYLLDSVRIGRHLFTHSRKYYPPDSVDTYFEEVFMTPEAGFGLLIHHSKTYLSQYTEIAPRGRFSETDVNKWLIRQGKPVKVNRRRVFLKQFEQVKRKRIRTFMNNHDIKYRRATSIQLRQLMNFCHNQLNNN